MIQTIKEKIEELHTVTHWDEDVCEQFVNLVYDFLDMHGYFISDFDGSSKIYPDKTRYIDRPLSQWLVDLAAQYNIET